MKFAKPLLISFSLLAFAGASAYANEGAKENDASQAKPSMSQSSKSSSASAGASASGAAKKEDFSRLDKDGDGMINRMEAAADADAKSRFEKLDSNKDEKLSQQEYQAWGSAAAGASASKSSQSAQLQQSQGQSASAGASSSSKSGQAQQGQMQMSKVIGAKVSGAKGEDLGEIKDVVIDMQGGKVHAAVLEFGGVLGMGEKNYAFPIKQLKQGKGNQFTLGVDKEKLKNAEGFAQGQWPSMNDEYWGRVGGQASAGASKSQGQKKEMNLVRGSELIGKEVQDKSGQDVGEIKDIAVDLKSGQLRDVMIDVSDGGQASVQAKALTTGTGDKIVLNMSAEQLKQQAKKSGKQAPSQGQGGGK
jgi:sporulation protein YlmC with PRC-barrel domain